MALERLTVEISADNKKLKQGISEAKKELNSLTDKKFNIGIDKNSLKSITSAFSKLSNDFKNGIAIKGFNNKEIKDLSTGLGAAFSSAFGNVSNGAKDAINNTKLLGDEEKRVRDIISERYKFEISFLERATSLTNNEKQELGDLLTTYTSIIHQLEQGKTVKIDFSKAANDMETIDQLLEKLTSDYAQLSNLSQQAQFNEQGQEVRDYSEQLAVYQRLIDSLEQIKSNIQMYTDAGERGTHKLTSALHEQNQTVHNLLTEYENLYAGMNGLKTTSDEYTAAVQRMADIQAELYNIESAARMAEQNKKAAKHANDVAKAWRAVKTVTMSVGRTLVKPFQKAFNTIRHGIRRISRMLLNAFIFSAVMSEFNKLRDKITSIINANEELKKSLATLRSAFMTVVMPIIKALEPIIIRIANLITLLLSKLAKLTSGLFGKTIAQTEAEAKALIKLENAQKRSLAGFDELTQLNLGNDDSEEIDTQPIEEIANTKTEGILATIEGIFEKLRPILEKVWETIKKIWNISKPLLDALLNSIDSLFGSGLLEKALDLVTKITETVTPLITSIVNVLSPILETVLSFVLDVLDGINTSLAPIINVLKDTLMPIIQRISDMVRPLLDKIGKTIGKLLEPLGELIAVLLDLILTALEPIFEALSPVFEIVGMLIEDLGDDLKPILILIVQLLKIMLIPLKAINTVLTFLQRIISGIITAITSVVHWLTRQLPNAVNKAREALGFLGTAFNKITEAIGKGFKAGLNKVIEGLEWVINKIISGINWCIRGINKAFSIEVPEWMASLFGMEDNKFSIDIKEIKEVSIPRFAKGGIINQPTLGLLGEKGREAVLPLDDTNWMDRLAERFSDNQSPVYLVIDGQKVGYAMINSINNITKQTGKPQLVMA